MNIKIQERIQHQIKINRFLFSLKKKIRRESVDCCFIYEYTTAKCIRWKIFLQYIVSFSERMISLLCLPLGKKNEEMFTEECKFDGFPHSMDGHHRSNKNFFGEIFSTAMVLQAILVSIWKQISIFLVCCVHVFFSSFFALDTHSH